MNNFFSNVQSYIYFLETIKISVFFINFMQRICVNALSYKHLNKSDIPFEMSDLFKCL